ncbi:hypothetical protein ACFL6K_05860 [Candidatus Latescibacterota bacterium]
MLINVPEVNAEEIKIIEGNADILVDGDLSDWDVYSSELVQMRIINDIIGSGNDNKVSSVLKSFADDDYIYVSADVSDDAFELAGDILDNTRDGITVFFCNDDFLMYYDSSGSNPSWSRSIPKYPSGSVSIYISSDENGKTIPVFYQNNNMFPYVCEELGVKSVFNSGSDGYTIEAGIPKKLLSLKPGDSTLNTMYIDVSDGHEFWFANSSFLSDYIEVGLLNNYPSVDEIISQKQSGKEEAVSHVPGSERDMIYSVLRDISERKWEEAEIKLKSLDQAQWINPALGWLQFLGNENDEAINTLTIAAAESPDIYAGLWAKRWIGFIYMFRMGDYDAAEKIYWELMKSTSPYSYNLAFQELLTGDYRNDDYEAALEIYDEAEKIRPLIYYSFWGFSATFIDMGHHEKAIEITENALSLASDLPPKIQKKIVNDAIMDMRSIIVSNDGKTQVLKRLREIIGKYSSPPQSLSLAGLYELLNDYESALEIYEIITESSDDELELLNARIGVARASYFIGDYDRALRLSEEIIDENPADSDFEERYSYRVSQLDSEARTIRILINRTRMMHKIYLALAAGVILIAVMRLYMRKRRVVVTAI